MSSPSSLLSVRVFSAIFAFLPRAEKSDIFRGKKGLLSFLTAHVLAVFFLSSPSYYEASPHEVESWLLRKEEEAAAASPFSPAKLIFFLHSFCLSASALNLNQLFFRATALKKRRRKKGAVSVVLKL